MFQIAFAGLLLAIGIVSEAYIKINHTTFITFGIYLTIGLVLPLWLGIIVGLLNDLLYQLLDGTIGQWYITMGVEKVMIVTIGFFLQFIYTLIKNRKLTLIISMACLAVLITGGSYFIFKDNQLSSDHIMKYSFFSHKYKLETGTQFTERWIKNGFAIAGMVFLITFMIFHIIHYIKGTKKNEYIATVLIAIFAAFIVQWLYHPWNVAMWYEHKMDVPGIWDHYDMLTSSAIISSIFYIGISVPIVTMFWTIYKSSASFKNKNRY